ncbi:sulfurtransferase [Pseudomonas sp. Q1-7]|uniref:sulfurtransferase n=1 Tax=Pseudomonas sp. Q1-7 TaxID=3020843 RepID=UPI00230044BF|nr:sulfurtransferase [Pseudomonas sp. Q1-7]
MDNQLLFRPEEVAALIQAGQAIVVDIRDRESYQAGHISGAVNAPDVFSYLAETSPEGLQALQAQFAEVFGKVGLDGQKVAIVYEDALNTRYGGSCRGLWLLQYLGYPKVGILDGGLRAWQAFGGTVDTAAVTPDSVSFPLRPRAELLVTKEQMLAALADPAIKLLDNRDKDEWLAESSSPYGKDFAPRKGRIPGAVWLEWYELMDTSQPIAAFKSAEQVRALATERGLRPDDDIIIYCFKGARAANTFVAMQLAGFTRLRIYLGSWNEWSRDESLPIESGLPKGAVRMLPLAG